MKTTEDGPQTSNPNQQSDQEKKVFIDPSIAVAALNANPKSMENDLETFGFIFENLCIRDLSVYTNSHGGKVSYYHDKSDLELTVLFT